MIKKLFLAAASLFLIWQSYDFLTKIHELETDSWGLLVFLAWLINMYITGIFAFATFAFPTHKLLPANYFSIKQPVIIKQVYKLLHVELFRKMLLATLWKSSQKRKQYFNGKSAGIPNLEVQSMKAEFGHVIPFVLLILIGLYLLGLGLISLALLTILINIIGNLYPVILQRHHRMRIQLIRNRKR